MKSLYLVKLRLSRIGYPLPLLTRVGEFSALCQTFFEMTIRPKQRDEDTGSFYHQQEGRKE